MASFELADGPRQQNGGAVRIDTRQIYPQTSAISGQRVGVAAPCTGLTQFNFTDDALWWVPSLSYFSLRGHFLDGSGNSLSRASGISYVDDWPSVLFSQISCLVNSQTIELLQNPAQSDAALCYSSCDKTWLQSFGTAGGIGEALTTRQLNSSQFGTAAVGATNYNEVVATWRPSLSLFDVCHGIPPGAQWRFDFSWSTQAEQNMVQSMASKIAGTDFTFTLDEFTFYKATIVPDVSIPRPMGGFISLEPVQVNQYTMTSGTGQFNVPLPATCDRMLIVFQDSNQANNLAAGQNGLKPITSFAAGFSSGATDFAATLQSLYVSFPELGIQAPNPVYQFTALGSAASKSDYQRAYADWCATCRGSSGGYEGSIPFGTADAGIGAAVVAVIKTVGPNVVTDALLDFGDPNNYEQNWYSQNGVGALPAATYGNQTARWGWMGSKTIFAVPCIRPPDKLVTNANLSVQIAGSPTSVTITVIMSYSMGLACELDSNGRYQFEILRGL